MKNEVFYAHSKEGQEKEHWQELSDHLKNTCDLASVFGADADVADYARIAASVHDLGKYSIEFQERLEGKKTRVDHSTAGAKEIWQLYKGSPQEPLAILLAYCIIGHHTGLPNYGDSTDLPGDGTLLARMKTEVCDYSFYKNELELKSLKLPDRINIRPIKGNVGFSLAFLTRMIYSALVDADFQETETFMQGKKSRGTYEDIQSLCTKFNIFTDKLMVSKREIDIKRTKTLRNCIDKAAYKPGFFSLTVPTGGGKTISSMAFALNHAKQNGMKRIIYVIPFTTIIEQNAAVFKEVLGEENVLEHHSNFDWEKKKQEEKNFADNLTNSAYAKLKLAAENWDIPIVVTTNVQFFESLFANRSSKCRKLHNIAKSVIIFDEAQMLPREYMTPAMYALWELVTNYGASSVFCTATQPDLGQFLPEKIKPVELVPDPQELFNFYRRVEIKNLGRLADGRLLERLNSEKQALCIVNTRRHAKGLFDGLSGEGRFHLSTLMCPAHRKKTLIEIHQKLGSMQPCRVVSTSVLEAGVDLDFPVGYRALAGLDSINQAAGRVNREMEQSIGVLYIFEPDSEFVKKVPKYISQNADVTRSVLRNYGDDPISIAAINSYFNILYSFKDKNDFDYKNVLGCFKQSQPFMFNFADATDKFRIIEENMISVIIPYEKEAEQLIKELKETPYPSSTLRKLQPYTVNIYEQEFNALNNNGAIIMIADKYATLNDMKFYDSQTGVIVPINNNGRALFD